MSTMLAREIAQLMDEANIGTLGTDIFIGELPQDVEKGLFVIEVPSPPPHEYVDTEYPVFDFWARSSHATEAHELLEAVYNLFHRRYGYSTKNWTIYFSRALGNIVDVDRDRESGKLFRLTIQFLCRNLNNVS